MGEKDSFLQEPHKIIQQKGKVTFTTELKSPKGLSATCSAMDNVAKAEHRDDIVRRSGVDDYMLSLEKLLHAFDTFIGERKWKKGSAGWAKHYNLSDSRDLTIFLLWQIRNSQAHHGGVIDEKRKEVYDKTRKAALEKSINPVIDLPVELVVGNRFNLTFEDYKSLKECVFRYIGNRIHKEDLSILSKRSSFTNLRYEKFEAVMHYDFGDVAIDIPEAVDCGCEINFDTGEFNAPCEMEFSPAEEKVFMPSVGKSFSARLV